MTITRDWLSLAEIAEHWSAETGEAAENHERDLEAWFTAFVRRDPAERPDTTEDGGDTTNQLMALLGGRSLQRKTFALYCEERGFDMPVFWQEGEPEAAIADRPSGLAWPSAAAEEALIRLAPDAAGEGTWPSHPPLSAEADGLENDFPGPRPASWTNEAPPTLPIPSAAVIQSSAGPLAQFARGVAFGLVLVVGGFILGKDSFAKLDPQMDKAPASAEWQQGPADLLGSLRHKPAEISDQVSLIGAEAAQATASVTIAVPTFDAPGAPPIPELKPISTAGTAE